MSIFTKLMREVTKKDSKFSWNKDLKEEFQNVKRVVSSVDMPAPYNPGLPLHLFTDASKEAPSPLPEPKGTEALWISNFLVSNGPWTSVTSSFRGRRM